MAADWARLCRANDLTINEPHIDVTFGDERCHRVSVRDDGDTYLVGGFVVRRATVASIPNLPIQAWIRNRATQLVGFRIDSQLRLVAEAWVPKAGLTSAEFQLYVRTVAAECDRFEYLLTGKDIE